MRGSIIKRINRRGNQQLEFLKGFKEEHVACWFGGILKPRAQTVPKSLVFFRQLQNNTLFTQTVSIPIPITHLGQVRLGTIWKEGFCTGEAELEEDTFQLDFTDGNWRFVSPFEHSRLNNNLLIQPEDYSLPYHADRNYLLEFKSHDKTVLIPCLEYYSRCYGSSEVRRIVATYPWEETCRRLFSQVTEPVPQGFWPVKLGLKLVNDDAVFVAHVQHDPYSAKRVKEIYSQLEVSYRTPNDPTFIKIAPWFEGEAKLILRGLWINDGKTFLALRIRGCSDPTGASVARDRVNTNKTDGIAPGDKEGWNGTQPRVAMERHSIVITGDHDPDQGSSRLEIFDDDFIRLEPCRDVRDIRRQKTLTVPGSGKYAADVPGSYSTGEVHGGSKDVGQMSLRSSITMESKGVLRDIWEALILAAKMFPNIIQSVEWFTFEDGFSSSSEPRLIALKVDDEGMDPNLVSQEAKRWCYIDGVQRGILVVRLMANERELYIVEIQRGIRNNKKADGGKEEEPFRGLIVELDNRFDFEDWLRNFALWIPQVTGVVKKLIGCCPGKAAVFKHSHNRHDKQPGIAALRNALSKMNIELPADEAN